MAGNVTRPRLLSIMAHQDDWEITCAGLWATLRARGLNFEGLVVATTDGRSGHQRIAPDRLVKIRHREATRAAAALGCRYEVLRDPAGKTFWNGQLVADNRARGAVWKLIRDFRPDVLFCPPRPADPRAGCHNDHVNTSTLVWSVAYQVQVPHAFPSHAWGTERASLAPPLIVNVYDDYLLEAGWDLAVDVTRGFDRKMAALHEHASQVYDWLPWVGKYAAPRTRRELATRWGDRHLLWNKRAGVSSRRPHEYFTVTRWGRPMTTADLRTFFPGARLAPGARRRVGL